MTTFSGIPAYVLGAGCFSRGLMAIYAPRSEYGHMGLQLESHATANPTTHGGSEGFASPLMYFKGVRELSYGAAMIALQWQGDERALTTFAAVLSVVRFADGLVVWLNGGDELRYRAWGHWITGIGMTGWVIWRWSY